MPITLLVVDHGVQETSKRIYAIVIAFGQVPEFKGKPLLLKIAYASDVGARGI